MSWDPVRDLLTMQERLESLFGRTTSDWMPAADVTELPDRYSLSMELPGLDRSDVTIEYAEPVLTVRGTRPALDCCPERYQQFERAQGEFSRSFRFDAPIAADAITADITDGVLTIGLPRLNGARQVVVR